MAATETLFDTSRHHIHLELRLFTNEKELSVDAILDTGAPITEFSDQFLKYAGIIDSTETNIEIKPGLQTQKYNRASIPSIIICGHVINNFETGVSRFEDSWGIDALVGLDFFRMFKVEIDYSAGKIVTSPF